LTNEYLYTISQGVKGTLPVNNNVLGARICIFQKWMGRAEPFVEERFVG
jgi:hypothetical protein